MANAPHKGANMNPGEYIGKDGGEYRWLYSDVMGWIVRDERGCVTGMKREDVTDAKAALDALLEAESEEWVEITTWERIRRDGTQPEWRYNEKTQWVTESKPRPGHVGFRKGREVAQAEQAEMRDDVWELVSMALTPLHRQDTWWSGTLADIAKKVGAKL